MTQSKTPVSVSNLPAAIASAGNVPIPVSVTPVAPPASLVERPPELSEAQLSAAELVVLGNSDSEVARVISHDRRTIGRWRRDPIFYRYVALRREELFAGNASRFAALVPQGLDFLQSLLKSNRLEYSMDALKLLLRVAIRTGHLDRPSLPDADE